MDVVAELVGAVDAVCATDPSLLADAESVEALHRQLDRLEAVVCRASASFDAGGHWQPDGARSAAAWIATRRRLPWATARRRLHLGRALRHLPVVEEAWLAGDISISHVAAVADARTASTEDALARDEAVVVGHARDLQFRHFARTLAYWCQLADPDGAEAASTKVHDGRRLHLSASWRGQWFLDGIFDAIGAEILANELKKIDDELFQGDWAEAKARVGERVCVADLARTRPAPGRRPGGDGPALRRAGGVRRPRPGHQRGGAPQAVHRGHPRRGAGAGAGVLPPLLRHRFV